MYWDEISFAKTFYSANKLVLAKRSGFANKNMMYPNKINLVILALN